MIKITVKILAILFLVISCAGAPPKPLDKNKCQQLRVNSHHYWNKYGCQTEQITGERASVEDCKISAFNQTEETFTQCMDGKGVRTTVKVFYTSKDLSKSAVGAIAGMVTGFGMGSQHTIEIFKLDDHPVVAKNY